MKKRVLAVMLAAAMVFSTAACGSGTEDSGEKGSQGESSGEEETEIQGEWENDKEETADFTITALSGETAAKAGSTLLY